MQRSAPGDEWSYVPVDDELTTEDDDAAPEESALHEFDPDERSHPAHDPGRADVDFGDDDEGEGPEAHWDDEDDGRPPRSDHEVDLEEVLEAQHYAFDASDGDEDD